VAYSEYDVVKVIALNPDVPKAEIGDKGTILMVFKHGKTVGYLLLRRLF